MGRYDHFFVSKSQIIILPGIYGLSYNSLGCDKIVFGQRSLVYPLEKWFIVWVVLHVCTIYCCICLHYRSFKSKEKTPANHWHLTSADWSINGILIMIFNEKKTEMSAPLSSCIEGGKKHMSRLIVTTRFNQKSDLNLNEDEKKKCKIRISFVRVFLCVLPNSSKILEIPLSIVLYITRNGKKKKIMMCSSTKRKIVHWQKPCTHSSWKKWKQKVQQQKKRHTWVIRETYGKQQSAIGIDPCYAIHKMKVLDDFFFFGVIWMCQMKRW